MSGQVDDGQLTQLAVPCLNAATSDFPGPQGIDVTIQTSRRDSCRARYCPSTSTTISLPTRKIRERVSVNRTPMQREIRPPFGFGLVFVVGYYLRNPASGDLSCVPRRRYEWTRCVRTDSAGPLIYWSLNRNRMLHGTQTKTPTNDRCASFQCATTNAGHLVGWLLRGMAQVQDRCFCVDSRKRLTLSIVCIKM